MIKILSYYKEDILNKHKKKLYFPESNGVKVAFIKILVVKSSKMFSRYGIRMLESDGTIFNEWPKNEFNM